MPDTVRQRYEESGRRTIAVLLAVGVALLAVALTAAALTLGSISENTEEIEQTVARQSSITRLATYNERIATGRRGFLLQPQSDFAQTVRDASGAYDAEFGSLQSILLGSVEQKQRLDGIERLSVERARIIERMFEDPDRAIERARVLDFREDRGVAITQQIREIAETMAAFEADDLNRRSRDQLNSLVRFYIVGGLALAVLIGVLTAAVVLVMRYNRDLTRAQTGLRQANEGLEDAVAARTSELSRANEEIQRFAYIVSHDLRSPLVNVLGFTAELDQARKVIHEYFEKLVETNPELRDADAWLAVEEDLPEALSFIRTSTEKMDRLINSILELSRQGRRTLAPELLDMNDLADTVVVSLNQQAEDAGATITVEKLPDIESDRIAVEQILSNLVENALKYLSPERTAMVSIEGSADLGMVQIDVIDNGRGVAPADHERIFDLFRRAGSQDQKGEGIGLANVRALAYRLGGTITVDSQLDRGARFRLSLPAKFVAREALA